MKRFALTALVSLFGVAGLVGCGAQSSESTSPAPAHVALSPPPAATAAPTEAAAQEPPAASPSSTSLTSTTTSVTTTSTTSGM